MLENVTSGRDSGHPEWLIWLQPGARSTQLGIVLLVLAVSIFGVRVRAQSAETNSVSVYADAIKQSTISERISGLERYLTLPTSGTLRIDALEFLVWDHTRLGHQAQSAQHAQKLLQVSPGNPIAIAILNQNPQAEPNRRAAENRLSMLASALTRLGQLGKPEGMLPGNFTVLRQQVAEMLNGEQGLTYMELKDYASARAHLQPAVASDPNNAQLVYALGLALLEGKNPNQYNGYWYLARAANLSGSTPAGQQISEYARTRYLKDGGKDAGWGQYLASAAALDAPPVIGSPAPRVAQPAAVVASKTNPSSGAPPAASPVNKAPVNSAKTDSVTASASAPSSKRDKKKPEFGFEDTLREPPSIAEPARPPAGPTGIAAPDKAISLGILVETSLLTNRNRPAIIATLRDIVRSLRLNDEACILVFSDQLDFEQDLTADDHLLEDAVNQIQAKPGRALISGIAFAAGHLKRIGKNANRVLLVISDGRALQSESDTLLFRSQISGVRIDTLGMDVDGESERQLLTRLASYSGGRSSFASNPGEFRTAALQITQSLGIAVP
ncbi:MAG TPA: VWA domain-containing protein [Verrucomicrobiae bacterium]|nr:VWA domain-containing protein [Verrucomicrobiae bacterium]